MTTQALSSLDESTKAAPTSNSLTNENRPKLGSEPSYTYNRPCISADCGAGTRANPVRGPNLGSNYDVSLGAHRKAITKKLGRTVDRRIRHSLLSHPMLAPHIVGFWEKRQCEQREDPTLSPSTPKCD